MINKPRLSNTPSNARVSDAQNQRPSWKNKCEDCDKIHFFLLSQGRPSEQRTYTADDIINIIASLRQQNLGLNQQLQDLRQKSQFLESAVIEGDKAKRDLKLLQQQQQTKTLTQNKSSPDMRPSQQDDWRSMYLQTQEELQQSEQALMQLKAQAENDLKALKNQNDQLRQNSQITIQEREQWKARLTEAEFRMSQLNKNTENQIRDKKENFAQDVAFWKAKSQQAEHQIKQYQDQIEQLKRDLENKTNTLNREVYLNKQVADQVKHLEKQIENLHNDREHRTGIEKEILFREIEQYSQKIHQLEQEKHIIYDQWMNKHKEMEHNYSLANEHIHKNAEKQIIEIAHKSELQKREYEHILAELQKKSELQKREYEHALADLSMKFELQKRELDSHLGLVPQHQSLMHDAQRLKTEYDVLRQQSIKLQGEVTELQRTNHVLDLDRQALHKKLQETIHEAQLIQVELQRTKQQCNDIGHEAVRTKQILMNDAENFRKKFIEYELENKQLKQTVHQLQLEHQKAVQTGQIHQSEQVKMNVKMQQQEKDLMLTVQKYEKDVVHFKMVIQQFEKEIQQYRYQSEQLQKDNLNLKSMVDQLQREKADSLRTIQQTETNIRVYQSKLQEDLEKQMSRKQLDFEHQLQLMRQELKQREAMISDLQNQLSQRINSTQQSESILRMQGSPKLQNEPVSLRLVEQKFTPKGLGIPNRLLELDMSIARYASKNVPVK